VADVRTAMKAGERERASALRMIGDALQKEAKLGGVTAWSYGQVWVPNNHVGAAEGTGDSRERSLAYLQFMSGGFAEK